MSTPTFRRHTLALALCCASHSAIAAEPILQEELIGELDWRPISVLPRSQQDLRCRQCQGAYVDPLANSDTSVAPEDSATTISAGDSEVTEGTLIFRGDVTLEQGYRSLRANLVEVDRQTEVAKATGRVTLREPGVLLRGDQASYENTIDKATLEGGQFVLHAQQLSGRARRITRYASGVLEIDDGAITYCAPADPVWQLQTERLSLNPEKGSGTAKGAKLLIGDTPIFYSPWLQFPIDDRRKTGLLFPDIGSDTRGGIDIIQPLYINLAPNYDATYSPRLIAERGLNHQANFRYLGEKIDFWSIDAAFISNDEKFSGEFPGSDGQRWSVGINHNGRFGDRWRSRIDFNKVSDTDYVKDFENNSLSAQRQTNLLQLGQLDYFGDQWTINVETQQFQSLAEDIPEGYGKLPQITASYEGTPELFGISPIANVQYSYFDQDDDVVTGQRLYTELGASYPMRWSFGYVRPTLKYRHIDYRLNNVADGQASDPSSGSAVFSFDGGLTFERPTTLGGIKMTQTLEPRLFYVYSSRQNQDDQPDFDTAELTFSYAQLYRDTRFSGNDRLDDANQIALGVTTRWYGDEDGREYVNASVGQLYYFKDRDIRLRPGDPALDEDESPIAGEANWMPESGWRLRTSFLYDYVDSEFDAASTHITYEPGDGRLFNIGYTLREPPPSFATRPVTEQANISAYYPLDDHWSVFGALEYSIEGATSVEDMFGVEYDDCCWRVRMLYMRYIDTAPGEIPDFSDPSLEREQALQFQVILKGMGGFGGRVDNLLRDMIRGFNDRY